MKTFILFLFCMFIVVVTSQNIPVNLAHGRAYVDPENVLEINLMQLLSPQGVQEVDVDRVHDPSGYAFEVELYSGQANPNLRDDLERALTGDLGLTGVDIKDYTSTRNFISSLFTNKATFIVLLDPNTAPTELQALAEDTIKKAYIELEDSPYD